MNTRRSQGKENNFKSKSIPKKKDEKQDKRGKSKQQNDETIIHNERTTRSSSKQPKFDIDLKGKSKEKLVSKQRGMQKKDEIEDKKTQKGKQNKRIPPKIEFREKDEEKQRKSRQSSKEKLIVTRAQFEQFEKSQLETKSKVLQKVEEDKKKQKKNDTTSKDIKDCLKEPNVQDIESHQDDEADGSEFTINAEVLISYEDEDRDDKNILEISSDQQSEQSEEVQKVKRGRGRLPSKDKLANKKSDSLTQLKQNNLIDKKCNKISIRKTRSSSKTNCLDDHHRLKQSNKDNIKTDSILTGKSEKIMLNDNLPDKKCIESNKDENEGIVSSKKSRGRPPLKKLDEDKVNKKQGSTEITDTPKRKKGRQPKSQEGMLSRRHVGEERKQLEYIEQNKKNKNKQEQEEDNLQSIKKNIPTLINNQAVILSKKPAKQKEDSIAELNYQKLNLQPIKNEYDIAIELLQEYSLPQEIPCRENEKKEILDFINEGLSNNGSSNCLCKFFSVILKKIKIINSFLKLNNFQKFKLIDISGVPGIGKTASFLEVIKKLQEEKKEEFTFIHINAMNLSNPENIYNILVKQITGQNCQSKQKACQILSNFQKNQQREIKNIVNQIIDELFTRGKLSKRYETYGENLDKKNKVILLDELDYLVTQDQELLYNLMEWPHHRYSKLTIIGIANTMNLPENLMNKIKSRMGSRRLVFNQYNHQQISQIVKTRLEKIDEVFESSAIEFACRKIAISSSDIRKTLKVLRKSVEICQKEIEQNPEQTKVTIQIIQKSYQQLYSSPMLICIKKLQFHHKLIILSIALENKHRGISIAYLSESYNRYRIMLSNLGRSDTLNFSQIKQLLNQLSTLNLVSLKEKEITKETQLIGLDPNKKHYCHVVDIQITSNFSVDDVTNSLKDDEAYLKFQFQF